MNSIPTIPLIPDGGNWKATMMIEYPDPPSARWHSPACAASRITALSTSKASGRVYAIADEDLERENDEKTSAVHWLRFELTPAMREAVRNGAAVTAGVDHPAYRHDIKLPAESAAALARDLG